MLSPPSASLAPQLSSFPMSLRLHDAMIPDEWEGDMERALLLDSFHT